MLKKGMVIILWLIMVCAGSHVAATPVDAGDYDGLWAESLGAYHMVRSVDDTILWIRFTLEPVPPGIFVGKIAGPIINLQTVAGPTKVTATVTIHSNNSMTGVLTSCTGECESVTVGEQMTLKKIF